MFSSVRRAALLLCALAARASCGPAAARPVIIAPAQFGVPRDYRTLASQLEARGHSVYVAPLTRFSWLRIAPATFTPEFWKGELRPTPTLGFYYEALDRAFASVDEEHGPDSPVSLIGHSIGGWVARAYLGERLGEERARARVQRLVTLGTPHQPPPEASPLSKVDQTRGLLTYINSEFPCGAPLQPSRVCCVIGSGTSTGGVGELLKSQSWDPERGRSQLLERLVALPSYLALSGESFGVAGDGLIPVQTGLLDGGCDSLVLDECHHAGFIPTALDSIELPDSYAWYGSESMVDKWAHVL